MIAKFFYKNKDAPKPNKPTHIGTTVILSNNDKILFELRRDCNRWSLIGGGLKINESLEECALREIKEETGIDLNISDLKFVKIYSDPTRIGAYPDGNVLRMITVLYKVELSGFEDLVCSEESKELRWFTKSRINGLDIVETHRHIIEDFLRKKN